MRVYPRTGGGNHRPRYPPNIHNGLSPHGRGKHGRPAPPASPHPVYPRTGGGNGGIGLLYLALNGLSPHGRGKQRQPPIIQLILRSIPARAGETVPGGFGQLEHGVYPRTGGGNGVSGQRGTHVEGLSPHGRGKREIFPFPCRSLGSIPARAGETKASTALDLRFEVYPRTGGGNRGRCQTPATGCGLSPHGRGKLRRLGGEPVKAGSIPARAGETRLELPAGAAEKVYPRTGGGNPEQELVFQSQYGLSPHGRGKLLDGQPPHADLWSIPARAGETGPPTTLRLRYQVYPRTGGGNPCPFDNVP